MTALAEIGKRANPGRRRFLISLTVTILSAFALVFVTVMGLTGVATYREAVHAAVASADREIADLTARTAARSAALVDPLYATVAVVAKLPDVTPGTGVTITQTEAAFLGVLDVLPQARAVSAASADGALLQVLNLDAMTADRRLALEVPHEARFAVRAVEVAIAGQRKEIWRFLDPSGHVLQQRPIGPAADTRDEIWFRTGLNNDGIATTVLHMFPALGVPGLTIVRRMPEGGVLGIDVGLDLLGTFLAEQRISPRASAFIIDDNGILLAHSDRAIAMSPGAAGQDPTWITIASSPDPIMREVWINYATGRLAPGRGIGLDVGGEAYMARVAALDHIGSPRALVAVVAPAADFTGPIERARDRTAIMFLVGGVAGLGLIALVASRITRPLAALTREADAIRRFDLDRPMAVSSRITEVARLAATMQAMKAALHTFGVYVPKDLVRQLMGGDGTARLGGERRVLTVMFTDIVGFTTIADGMDAETLMRLTSEYFEAMTRELMGAGGTIDKYVGDAVMALWNAPGLDDRHAARGCLAALRCRDLSDRLTREFGDRGWPALRTRFGVNTGEAVIGNVGSTDRMSYTAIGATVNMASRLEGLNKQYGTQILVTAATREAAGTDFVFRLVDRVLPKGRQKATDIHELLGLRSAGEDVDQRLILADADIDRAARWDSIVAAYLDRRFVEARLLLPANTQPDDRLGALYRQRLDAFIAEPPGSGWDGVAAYVEK
jgi:adenylate cyclase